MMENGYIRIHRKLEKWEWYTDSKMVHLFLHLLLRANHEDGKWQGYEIKRGQLITGLFALKASTGISTQSLRTCLERLKSTNEITIKTTNKFSLITILHYNDYQAKYNQLTIKSTSQLTNEQQTTNKQLTTNKNEKNEKNEKNYIAFEQAIFEKWNSFVKTYPILSAVREITDSRRLKIKKRFEKKSFQDFDSILKAISEQPFLLAENDKKWKVSFDWLIENDTNYIKISERKYLNKIDFKRKNIEMKEPTT